MAAKWEPPDGNDTIQLYKAGKSPKSIGQLHGVSENAVVSFLRRQGAKIRGRSEANAIKWFRVKSAPNRVELITRQCGAAWRAARTRTIGDREMIARANTAQSRCWTRGRFSKIEAAFNDAFLKSGLQFTRQFAIHRYNVDFAIHNIRFAIEVSGAPPNHKSVERYKQRLKYMLDSGWFVLYVEANAGPDRKPFRPDLVADKIHAIVNRLSRDKSLYGKYGVIGRQGNSSAAFRKYFHDFTRVEPL